MEYEMTHISNLKFFQVLFQPPGCLFSCKDHYFHFHIFILSSKYTKKSLNPFQPLSNHRPKSVLDLTRGICQVPLISRLRTDCTISLGIYYIKAYQSLTEVIINRPILLRLFNT